MSECGYVHLASIYILCYCISAAILPCFSFHEVEMKKSYKSLATLSVIASAVAAVSTAYAVSAPAVKNSQEVKEVAPAATPAPMPQVSLAAPPPAIPVKPGGPVTAPPPAIPPKADVTVASLTKVTAPPPAIPVKLGGPVIAPPPAIPMKHPLPV